MKDHLDKTDKRGSLPGLSGVRGGPRPLWNFPTTEIPGVKCQLTAGKWESKNPNRTQAKVMIATNSRPSPELIDVTIDSSRQWNALGAAPWEETWSFRSHWEDIRQQLSLPLPGLSTKQQGINFIFKFPLVKPRRKINFKGQLSFWQGYRKKKVIIHLLKKKIINELRWVLLSSVFRELSLHHQHQHPDVNAKDEKETCRLHPEFGVASPWKSWLRSENVRFNRKRYWRLIQSSEMSLVFIMKKTLTNSGNNWTSTLTPTLTLKLTLTLSLLLTLTITLPLTPRLNQMLAGGLCSGSHLSWNLTQQVGEHMHSERW